MTLQLLPSAISDLPSIEDGQPSSSVPHEPSPVAPTPLHLLKFKYDATASNVAITLTLHATPGQGPVQGPREIYYGIHPGGFNQSFALPPTHAIDLSPACAPLETVQDDEYAKFPPKLSSTDSEIADDPLRNAPTLDAAPAPTQAAVPPPEPTRGRRFGGLLGRRRDETPTPAQLEAGTGIELENVPENREAEAAVEVKPKVERGMRILIRIEALGESGTSQITGADPVLTLGR